jgi:hypothetical protein
MLSMSAKSLKPDLHTATPWLKQALDDTVFAPASPASRSKILARELA